MTIQIQEALADISDKLDRVMDELLPNPAAVQNKVISLHSREEKTELCGPPSGEAKVMEAMR